MAKSKLPSYPRDDLIRNKLATGREQDILDVKQLRAAKQQDPT
jgi:hypothetical protein